MSALGDGGGILPSFPAVFGSENKAEKNVGFKRLFCPGVLRMLIHVATHLLTANLTGAYRSDVNVRKSRYDVTGANANGARTGQSRVKE